MRGWLGVLAGAALVIGAGSALAEVNLGDPAPALEIKEWIQGEPVVLANGVGKTVYVVEFWATWCPPCKASIPHLSKLAEKFKGQVEFIGVSDEDAETIKEFAKDGKFKYHVAADSDRNTYGAYMPPKAGIPTAYVIDKQGVVVWSGHPMGGLDAVLDKVVAGKFDLAKAKQAEGLRKELIGSVATQDPDKILPAADKLLEVAPDDETAVNLKYQCYLKKEDAASWKTFVQQNVAKIDGDWHALNAMAWRMATEDKLAWRDPATAMKAARRAVELSGSKESAPLDTLARVQFETGLLEQAIESQKKACALDDKDEDLKKVLAYYNACAEVKKQAGGADPAKGGKKK